MAIKYYLGLDLGIASCGWAVMAEDTNIEISDPEKDRFYIHDFGVRIFDPVEVAKTKVTLAAERRGFRATRRLYRRRHHRLERIKRALSEHKFLTVEAIDKYVKSLTNNDGVTTTEKLKYDTKKYINPYVLRNDAMHKKVSKEEVAYCLLNLAKHRGYLNAFDEEEKGKSGLKTACDDAKKFIGKYETISEAVVNNPDFIKNNKIDIRNNQTSETTGYKYLFRRKEIQKEIIKILTKQQTFYPEITDELITQLENIIVQQRDFEDGPSWKYRDASKPIFERMIGYCKYEPEEKVGFKTSIVFELFHIASEVSKFTVAYKQLLDIEKIHVNVIKYVIEELYKEPGKTYQFKNEFKKIILNSIKEGFEFNDKVYCNSQNPLWKNIDFKINYIKKCKEVFGPDIFKSIDVNNLTNDKRTFDFGEIISNNITPKRRKEKILEQFGDILTVQKYDELKLESYQPTGTCNLSYKIMQEWIDRFLQGEPTNTFQHEYQIHPKSKIKDNKFLGPLNDPDIKTNQTVYRAINQTRKVLKALFNKYGQFVNKDKETFSAINIEVARDLYASVEDRKKMTEDNLKNQVLNAGIIKTLDDNEIKANESNILKYKLFQNQKEQCVYCAKSFTLSDINITNDLQVDHIIPISKFANDSLNNKVLVCAKCNQDKGDRTPIQWMKATGKNYKTFTDRVKKLRFNELKEGFLLAESLDEEVLEGFASRNLNDTRYITRFIMSWLKKELDAYYKTNNHHLVAKQKGNGDYNINPLRGNVTSRYRRTWLKWIWSEENNKWEHNPWGLEKKVREITHWHHAVDAMVIASFTNKSNIDFASDIIIATNSKRKFDKKMISKEEFDKIKKDMISKYNDKHVWVKSATFKLNKIFDGSLEEKTLINYSNNIKNFSEMVVTRIPVKLKAIEQEIAKDNITKILKVVKLDEKQINDKYIKKEFIPEYSTVLTEEEYFNQPQIKEYQAKYKNKNQCNIHYPYVSHMIIRKIKGRGTILGSQMPMKKKAVEKIKNIDLIKKDNYGNTWDLRTYYGINSDINSKQKTVSWLKAKMEINEKNQKIDLTKIIVPNENVEGFFEGKNFTFVYYGISGDRFFCNINGLIKTIPISNNSSTRFSRGLKELGINYNKLQKNISILGEK
ncbi:type II CRISPR RNA-guided endonuclease Cas9 [Spiroplasma endosymbiont of Amphibalanus improvisus]|uniref:type II CRISPR RNA-guided endonuclease Cas9 n=1 Tax=Spiroplasma endosymbiont of Amphibalanus improvisus TaxID=3066327 RepID=UPI00313F1F39